MRELLLLSLKLGLTAFGGPAVHIAMLRREVIARQWLNDERFVELLGVVNLLPGPNSTELVMHIGLERAGWPGLWLAGLAFIAPAALITSALAWLYLEFGQIPAVEGLLLGLQAAVIAIVGQALLALAKTLTSTLLWAIAIAAAAASLAGVHELLIVVIGASISLLSIKPAKTLLSLSPVLITFPNDALSVLFWSFLRIGATLYGSGYVLVGVLLNEFHLRLGWLSARQVLDAIVVGQITPGPLFSSATFIGYLVAGPLGALVASVAMFLPAFVLVMLAGSLLPRLRRLAGYQPFMRGLAAAALGLMLAALWQLLALTISPPAGGLGWLALVGLAGLALWCGVGPLWSLAAGAAGGLLHSLLP
jgi:chromate transporter